MSEPLIRKKPLREDGLRECDRCGEAKPVTMFGRGSRTYVCFDCFGKPLYTPLEEIPMDVGPAPVVSETPPAEHPFATVHVSPVLLSRLQETMGLESHADVDLEAFLTTHAIVGTVEDRRWLVEVCLPRGHQGPFNLATVHSYLSTALQERDEAYGRAVEAAKPLEPVALTPADISIDLAAQALYWQCRPEIRERFDAACESMQQPLWRVLLGCIAYHKDEIHTDDPAFVDELMPLTQIQAMQRAGMAGQPLGHRPTNAQGQFLRTCQVCQSEFVPHKDKPNQANCTNDCGEFASQLQRYWLNTVRYPDVPATQPDPYMVLKERRSDSQAMLAAQTFIETSAPQYRELAEKQVAKMRGAA
jgi:hypothetical protein